MGRFRNLFSVLLFAQMLALSCSAQESHLIFEQYRVAPTRAARPYLRDTIIYNSEGLITSVKSELLQYDPVRSTIQYSISVVRNGENLTSTYTDRSGKTTIAQIRKIGKWDFRLVYIDKPTAEYRIASENGIIWKYSIGSTEKQMFSIDAADFFYVSDGYRTKLVLDGKSKLIAIDSEYARKNSDYKIAFAQEKNNMLVIDEATEGVHNYTVISGEAPRQDPDLIILNTLSTMRAVLRRPFLWGMIRP